MWEMLTIFCNICQRQNREYFINAETKYNQNKYSLNYSFLMLIWDFKLILNQQKVSFFKTKQYEISFL